MVKSVEVNTVPEPLPENEFSVGDKFKRTKDTDLDNICYGMEGFRAGDIVTIRTVGVNIVTLSNGSFISKKRLLDPLYYTRVT